VKYFLVPHSHPQHSSVVVYINLLTYLLLCTISRALTNKVTKNKKERKEEKRKKRKERKERKEKKRKKKKRKEK
jgi:hypothetical protein